MIIDVHTHTPTQEHIRGLATSMKKNHVSRSVVLHWPFDAWDGTPAVSLETLVAATSLRRELSVAGACRVTDEGDRGRGVPLISHLLGLKRLCAVKFYPGYEQFYPTDARCDDLYDLCERYDVPAIFHAGDLYPHSGAHLKYAEPIHIDAVATARPNMKIVIAHCGNPFFDQTKVLLTKHDNVYADISGMLPYTPASKQWLQLSEKVTRNELVETMAWCGGPAKFMFGSDSPIYTQRRYLDFAHSIMLDAEEREAFMHGTAKEIFKL